MFAGIKTKQGYRTLRRLNHYCDLEILKLKDDK
jgi:hypothetical protein